ncbi:MAG: hypothetical protein U0234_21235 [Sandaracinus sp.]
MKPLFFCGVLALAVGCASQGRPGDGEASAVAPSQALLSALGTAQALQHESDEREARGEIDLAVASARRILEVPFDADAPEREDVRLDAYGRLAELELARSDDAAAEREAQAGLGESTRDSYFRARLHVVLGRVHQARAAALRERGDENGARVESEAAIDALERSIAINRVVLGLPAEPAHGEETP